MLHKIIFTGMLLLFPLSAHTEDPALQKQEREDRLAALIGQTKSVINISIYFVNSENGVENTYSYCVRIFFSL